MERASDFEGALLGRLILSPETSDYAFERLVSDHFYSESNRIIFKHLRDLWELNSCVETLTLCHSLDRGGVLDKVGGQVYIVDLVDAAVMPSSLDYYVDQIVEAWRCRTLRVLGSEISNRVVRKETSEEIVAAVESRLNEIVDNCHGDRLSNLESLNIDELRGNLNGYATGFIDLDKRVGGLPRGEFWVVAGRPSVGKTAFGLNVAINLAKQNIPVGFLSIEMSLPSLKERIVASEAKLTFADLQNEEHRERLEEIVEALRGLPIWLDDSPNQSIATIRSRAHRLVRSHGIKVLFLDYLQLVQGPKAETREREIGAISGTLKALAKELDISVVALCQLNRRCEERADKRPVLADLRESGAIEQDADGVILLHRPELYRIKQFDDGESTSGVVEATLAKNRNGETGTFRLTFRKKLTRFENYEKGEGYGPA